MLLGLEKQLFWPSWKEDAESDMVTQISDVCQEFMKKRREYLDNRRCLRSNLLDFLFICIFGSYIWMCRMTKSSKKFIIISGESEIYSLPSEQGGETSSETSASGADAMVKVRLEEPGIFWIVFLVLVAFRFLPAATSARVGEL